MSTTDATLLLAPRINETGLQLRTAAGRRGLRAHTAASWRAPQGLAGTRVHLYGGPLFADAVGRELGLAPLEPSDGWLAALPRELTLRRVELTTLAEARRLPGPAFVKAPADKHFTARVYPDGSALPGPELLDGATPVLVSEVVRFDTEFRLFVLDGTVRAASRYARGGELSFAAPESDAPESDGHKSDAPELLAFAADVLAAATGPAALPSAAVVDLGRTPHGWAVVEANAAWASGGYACDPDAVLDVVLRAAGPLPELPSTDRPFLRPLPEVVR
ncbi:ATP-grasp domain-containing protein [Kitasatospora sp. NRRL B-11411]|uniref:ATP-grasp domain-containing protein n=1 Tax=Kitasatospora sp. NRRL B-11411 TaxID=1463822 RepID=UPI0004C33596|nr:ATP-grasp domain-containing protein [Kitasatospora sp. NRRL B-11411]